MALPKPQTSYQAIYFAPDLDQSWEINPGVLSDVSNLIPSKRNTLKTYASSDSHSVTTGFAESTYGRALAGGIFKKTDGTARLIVGTPTRLMEATNATTWNDRSLSGSDYTTAADWCFTTFGNDLIAVSKANAPQVSSSTTFADLGGTPPKASLCTTQKNFVILGDCNDGVNNHGDQVWWSAIGNDASWTPDAATQAGNLRLRDTAGNLTALVNMRDAVAVYKEDSLYILDYQGSPLLWTARLVSDRVGCAAKNGVAVVNGIHYFLHRTGVHRFDGASVQPIGEQVNRYLFDKMGSQVNYATVQAAYDEYEGTIFWFFHDSGAGTGERRYALTFNPFTGKYGFVSLAWASGTGTCYAAMRCTLSDVTAWLSSQATQTTNILTVGKETTNGGIVRRPVIGDYSGNSQSSLATGDIGNDSTFTTLTMIKPRVFNFGNSIAGATVKGKDSYGATLDSGVSFIGSLSRIRYEGTKSNRWLRVSTMVTDTFGEIAGLTLTTTQSGTE